MIKEKSGQFLFGVIWYVGAIIKIRNIIVSDDWRSDQ